jgi:argininosuccinate lyase
MKGLPLAYSKDMQEDKEPLFDSVENIILSLQVLDGIINDITFNTKKMLEMAQMGHSNATDLADYIVQKCGVPFRDAHHITGKIVRIALEKDCKIQELSLNEMQEVEPKISQEVFEFLDTHNVVKRRNSFGGTGFEQVKKQVVIAVEFVKSFNL